MTDTARRSSPGEWPAADERPVDLERGRDRVMSVLSRDLFFVCGAPKSGTTWLQRLLDAHPELACSGEGHLFSLFEGELSTALRKYNRALRSSNAEVYDGDGPYVELDDDDAAFLLVTASALLLGQRSLSDGVRAIGDKTPTNGIYAPRILSLFPSARFVNIVRDGRDTVISGLHHIRRVAQAHGRADAPLPPLEGSVAMLAKRWVDFVAPTHEFAQQHPDSMITVTYENLHREPVRVLGEIVEFLGVDSSETVVADVVETSSFSTLTGRAPGDEDVDAFLRKGVVGDWENHFDDQSLAVFDQIAGPWLEVYGY